ncbi:MAG: hypothetical protein AAGH90_12630 [Pseudomonadota bacterium]
MTDSQTQLSDWCQSYVSAFSAYDVSAISNHWAFPALILRQGSSLVLKNREQFDRNTNALIGFYRARGVDHAKRRLLEAFQMDAETASMRVADQMLNAEGDTIVAWQVAYVLQKRDGVWRAICASADGESVAWEAAGTPLQF